MFHIGSIRNSAQRVLPSSHSGTEPPPHPLVRQHPLKERPMKHTAGNPDELKTKFWKALADSPFLFLQLDGHSATAVPMSPQLDKDANSSIWFFTHTKSDFAKLGSATATFEGYEKPMRAARSPGSRLSIGRKSRPRATPLSIFSANRRASPIPTPSAPTTLPLPRSSNSRADAPSMNCSPSRKIHSALFSKLQKATPNSSRPFTGLS